jgi:hypothetical protein
VDDLDPVLVIFLKVTLSLKLAAKNPVEILG